MIDAIWSVLLPTGAAWHTMHLADAEHEDVIPHGVRGEPLWPTGIVGSITHAGGYRVVATVPAGSVTALGIDMEPLAPLAPSVWKRLFDVTELEELVSLPAPQRGLAALERWCLKEALFKALQGCVALDEISLCRHEGNEWRPAPTLGHRLLGISFDPAQLELQTATTGGWQFATACHYSTSQLNRPQNKRRYTPCSI